MIEILAAKEANKRAQLITGVGRVTTAICVLMDDHVEWKDTFLTYALPAFERNPQVGIVGTNKRVPREAEHENLQERIRNMIQCLYLERHNYEICSSNAVDGGVFVVSGRTSLVRTSILQNKAFINGYLHDYFLFGLVGPLAVDDDNFLTRWCVARGWRVKIQYSPQTLITTPLGSAKKFTGGLKRWVRTTWRSNSTSLTSLHVYLAQPWSVYAVYLSLLTNFALFYDPLLQYAFVKSGLSSYHLVDSNWMNDPIGYNLDGSLAFGSLVGDDSSATTASTSLFVSLLPLICWIFTFKMVKPFAYFWRHPQDLTILWAYILFTYFHSLIKLNGLLTFYNAKWEGRDLAALNADLARAQSACQATSAPTSVPSPAAAQPTSSDAAGAHFTPGSRFVDVEPSISSFANTRIGPSSPPLLENSNLGFLTALNKEAKGTSHRGLPGMHFVPPEQTPVGSTSLALENFHIDQTYPAGTENRNPNVNPFAFTSPYATSLALGRLHMDDDDHTDDDNHSGRDQ